MKRIFLALTIWFLPFFALAANEVTVDEDITLILPDDGSQYTLKKHSKFDTMSVNNTTFDFTISLGGRVVITSGNKKNLSNTANKNTECGASESSLQLDSDVTGNTVTVTVTPSGTCGGGSTGGGSSSGGGGGGGGGGSYTPPPAPPPPPVSAPAPAPAPATPSAPSVTFSLDLKLGDKNSDVMRLQSFLASDKALYPEGVVSGFFGSLTKEAVKRFQAKYKLPVTGYVGPLTRAKLAEVFGKILPVAPPAPPPAVPIVPPSAPPPSIPAAFSKNLGVGVRNKEVQALQEFLAKDPILYPEGTASGYFGSLTKRAVERFQEKYEIAKSGDSGYGYVGPKTRAKLNELIAGESSTLPSSPPASPSTTPPPSNQTGPTPPPAKSDDEKIKELQEQLKKLQEEIKAVPKQ